MFNYFDIWRKMFSEVVTWLCSKRDDKIMVSTIIYNSKGMKSSSFEFLKVTHRGIKGMMLAVK